MNGEEKIIEHAQERIVTVAHPRKIILFGSRARGIADPDSDVDLLVVVEDPIADRWKLQRDLRSAVRDAELPVEPWVMGAQEFEETRGVVGGLAYPAATEGKVLYEKV